MTCRIVRVIRKPQDTGSTAPAAEERLLKVPTSVCGASCVAGLRNGRARRQDTQPVHISDCHCPTSQWNRTGVTTEPRLEARV